MPINTPIPGGGNFAWSWLQPSDSMLNEGFGPDQNQAKGTIQFAGDGQTRRNAGKALLEYPILTKTVTAPTVPPTVATYIRRAIPLAYPTPVWASPDDGAPWLYATQFPSGRGTGPKGPDPNNAPLPLYKFFHQDISFTDRTYDILADSQVLGGGAIAAPVQAVPVLAGGGNIQTGVAFSVVITALDANGETTVSNEKNVLTVANNTSVVISWTQVAGAIGYNVYTGGAGAESNLAATTGMVGAVVLFSLAGANQTPPTANTTGSPLSGFPDEGYALANGNGTTGSRYITRNSRQVNRGSQIPRGLYSYTMLNGTVIATPEGLLRVQPAIELVYTWHQIPRGGVPNQAIVKQVGTVSSSVFDGWPAGSLLLEGIEKRYYRSPIGGRVIDMQYRMVALPNIDRNGIVRGHNSTLAFLGPDGSGAPVVDYAPVYAYQGPAGSKKGSPLFQSSNFANLFRPDQL